MVSQHSTKFLAWKIIEEGSSLPFFGSTIQYNSQQATFYKDSVDNIFLSILYIAFENFYKSYTQYIALQYSTVHYYTSSDGIAIVLYFIAIKILITTVIPIIS